MCTLGPWAGRVSDKEELLDGFSVPADTPALGVSLWSEKEWTDVHRYHMHTSNSFVSLH